RRYAVAGRRRGTRRPHPTPSQRGHHRRLRARRRHRRPRRRPRRADRGSARRRATAATVPGSGGIGACMSRPVQLAPVRVAASDSVPGAPTTLHLAYERAGAGRPVLLVHGNFASRRWWSEQLDDPASGLDLIAPDLPGFGRSDPLPDTLPEAAWVAAWADALAGLLDALGLEHAGVVGHSLGGAVAQALAIRHPRRVGALLLVDSAPPGGFPTPEAHYPVLEAMKTDRNLLHASLAAISPTRVPPYFDDLVDDA